MPEWTSSKQRHPRVGLLARSQGPFALSVAVVVVMALVLHPDRTAQPQFVGAVVLTVAGVALTLLVPWERLHPLWLVTLSAVNLTAAGMILHSVGDVLDAAFMLGAFPLLWLAFGFGRLGAALALLGTVLHLWLPQVIYDTYPADARTWSELITLTLLTAGVVTVVSAQAQRYRDAQSALEETALAREVAMREREHAMQEQERVGVILRSVAEEVDMGLAFFDEDRRVLLNNRASIELSTLGEWDRSTGVVKHAYRIDSLEPLRPDEQPLVRIFKGESVHDFLYWIGPSGSRRAILNNGRPVLDDAGTYRGAVLVAQDITPLLDAIRVREQSLATLSHELRTPLTALLGNLDLLEDDDLALPMRNRLAAMSRSAGQLFDLAERFLAASGPAPTPRYEQGDLGEIVSWAVEELPDQMTRTNSLSVHIPEGTTVHADPLLLQRVIDIVLRNALAYSPDGEVTLTATTLGETLDVSVADTGIGIPAADLPRIFERFYRASNAKALAIRGVGLGLSVARSIIDAHGGLIAVQSTEDAGTTVTISLPTGSPRQAPIAATLQSSGPTPSLE